jgi:hypothetical protein
VRISVGMVGILLNSSLRRQSSDESQLNFASGECSIELRKEPVRIVDRSGSAEADARSYELEIPVKAGR